MLVFSLLIDGDIRWSISTSYMYIAEISKGPPLVATTIVALQKISKSFPLPSAILRDRDSPRSRAEQRVERSSVHERRVHQ